MCFKMTILLVFVIWFLGVLVAREQLRYWFRDRVLTPEEYDELMFFSVLSWGIYPVYLLEWIANKLKE